MSAVHFHQLIINATVRRGITSGASFQQIVGVSVILGGPSLCNVLFLQQ